MCIIGTPSESPGARGLSYADTFARWIEYDSWHGPSRPHTPYPQTRGYGASQLAATSQQNLQRQERSALFFRVNHHGGNAISHHRHISPC